MAEPNNKSHMDDSILTYMVERQWAADQKIQRKRYLCHLARQCRQDRDIASKIGGMLIYNQVIEQFLADIVEMSIHYIKADLWPVTVSLDVDLKKATFGKMIDHFTEFATIEPNREMILVHLKKFNAKRNQVVHDLFDISDLRQLALELDEYAQLADEILRLLDAYTDQVSDHLCRIADRINFREYLK